MLTILSSWDYNWELKCYINGYYTSDQCNSSKFAFPFTAQNLEPDKHASSLQRIFPSVKVGSDPILWVKNLFAAWKERLLLTQKNDHDDHEVISIEHFMAVGDVKYHKII